MKHFMKRLQVYRALGSGIRSSEKKGRGLSWEGECAVREVWGRKETQGIIEIKGSIMKTGLCLEMTNKWKFEAEFTVHFKD